MTPVSRIIVQATKTKTLLYKNIAGAHSPTDTSPCVNINPLMISRSNLFVVSRRAHNLENTQLGKY